MESDILKAQQLLKDYRPDDQALGLFRKAQILVFTGPFGVGKNAVINELLSRYPAKYYRIISTTSRQPRLNDGYLEQNGQDYWFISNKQFVQGLKEHQFIEAELIHHKSLYGKNIAEFQKFKEFHKIAIFDSGLYGLVNLLTLRPDLDFIFLLPPSFEEWLNRIEKRSNFETEEKIARFEDAITKFQYLLDNSVSSILINDSLSNTVSTIENWHNLKQTNNNHQKFIKHLINQTKTYLKTLQ